MDTSSAYAHTRAVGSRARSHMSMSASTLSKVRQNKAGEKIEPYFTPEDHSNSEPSGRTPAPPCMQAIQRYSAGQTWVRMSW